MSGAHDLFWLARYAYNAVSPLVKEDEVLITHLQFETNTIDVWIHDKDTRKVRNHRLNTKTWQEVEKFAATLKPLVAVA